MAAIAALLALAGGLFAVAWLGRQVPALLAQGRAGPITTAGSPHRLAFRSETRKVVATDLTVSFAFTVAAGDVPSDLFEVGSPGGGLRMQVGRPVKGLRSVALLTTLQDGSPVDVALGTVRAGARARARVVLAGGKLLRVSLNRHTVTVEYPFVQFAPPLTSVDVGSGYGGQRRFAGRLEGFRLTFSQHSVPVQGTAYRALEIGAACSLALAALLAVFLVSALANSGGSSPDPQGKGRDLSRPMAARERPVAVGLGAGEVDLVSKWAVLLVTFGLALCIWWVAYSYFRNPNAAYGLGFWNPSDRAAWLPVTAPYYPLVGQHFFGDFFQFYYLIRTHTVYTGAAFHTDLNPGYLLPSALVSWLPYPAAGTCYVTMLLSAWVLPGFVIGRRRPLLGALYLLGATLTVPALMALDLGQPQVFLYVLALGALALFPRRTRTSAVLLGVAIAVKPYMLLFVLPYLLRRRYRDALLAVGVAVGVNVALGFALGGVHFFSPHVLGQIIVGMTSYGSGASLKIWGGQPFLHDNSSLFALVETLHLAGTPIVGAAAGALAAHYTIVEIVIGVALVWLLAAKRAAMTLEDQWLLLTATLLVVPSYSLGYAWLLLLVPLAARAWTAVSDPTSPAPPGGARAYLPLLAVVPYPAVITGPAFPNAAFGPNGNTVVTPLLVAALLVAIAWHYLPHGPVARLARAAWHPLGRVRAWRERPVGLDGGFLAALASGIVLEIAALVVCVLLSVNLPAR